MLLEVIVESSLQAHTPELEFQLINTAISLLGKYKFQFDPVVVLKMLPVHWPLSSLSYFISACLRRSLHSARQTAIEASIASTHYLNTHTHWSNIRATHVHVSDRSCHICGEMLGACGTFRSFFHGQTLVHAVCAESNK
eukprot:GHVR01120403.1.p1 GENE.GHVR01120403.1~~GHVR01120403.1.p1  ORF type:complete len:139 (-),score=28.69 GHVR01120403.1:89-505(-)